MIRPDVSAAWAQLLAPVPAPCLPAPARRAPQLPVVWRSFTNLCLEGARWCSRLQVAVKPRTRRFQVRETTSLGEKRLLAIVAVDGVEYLIGASAANVSLLTPLGGATVPDFAQTLSLAGMRGDEPA